MQPLQILTQIYTKYEQSSATPDTTSDDFAIRLANLNSSIAKWEDEAGVIWKELITPNYSVTFAADGTVSLPAGFNRPLDSLFVGTKTYNYVQPQNYEKMVQLNNGNYYFTVTGLKGAKTLSTFPAASGTGTLDYVRYAWYPITGQEAQEVEMSNGYFAVFDGLSQLYMEDQNINQASVEGQTAAGIMQGMKLANESATYNNPNEVTDNEFQGFGI